MASAAIDPAAGSATDLPDEEWRPVPGYEGLYEVSSLGRLRSLDRRVRTVRSRAIGGAAYFRQVKGRIVATAASGTSGYENANLYRAGATKGQSLHCLVCEAFHGPRPKGAVVAHADGDKLNNKASNLRYANRQENAADCHVHGTSAAGERNRHAKLTEADAIKIIDLRGGSDAAAVASMFGVTRDAIRLIWNGRRWKHLPRP